MKKYFILNNRCIKREHKIILFIIGGSLVISSLITKNFLEVIIGLILLYMPFFSKKTFITEEGIEIYYNGLVYNHKERINFIELTNIRIEQLANNTALHFLKNHIGKRLIFDNKDAKNIIKLAKTKNNSIYFDELKI